MADPKDKTAAEKEALELLKIHKAKNPQFEYLGKQEVTSGQEGRNIKHEYLIVKNMDPVEIEVEQHLVERGKSRADYKVKVSGLNLEIKDGKLTIKDSKGKEVNSTPFPETGDIAKKLKRITADGEVSMDEAQALREYLDTSRQTYAHKTRYPSVAGGTETDNSAMLKGVTVTHKTHINGNVKDEAFVLDVNGVEVIAHQGKAYASQKEIADKDGALHEKIQNAVTGSLKDGKLDMKEANDIKKIVNSLPIAQNDGKRER